MSWRQLWPAFSSVNPKSPWHLPTSRPKATASPDLGNTGGLSLPFRLRAIANDGGHRCSSRADIITGPAQCLPGGPILINHSPRLDTCIFELLFQFREMDFEAGPPGPSAAWKVLNLAVVCSCGDIVLSSPRHNGSHGRPFPCSTWSIRP